MRSRISDGLRWVFRFVSVTLFGVGCAVTPPPDEGEATARRSDAWDSQAGNPTHATHSYLTTFAVDSVMSAFPEADEHRAAILSGANTELHDLPLSDAGLEALRIDFGGTNAGCEHPEIVWQYADGWHGQGNLDAAYWFVGVLLHYVEDMGVPAHALGVYHQATFADFDDFELLALQRYHPRFDIGCADPWIGPADYVAWSGAWTAADFAAAFPETDYTTGLFPRTWALVTDREQAFVEEREGRTAMAATWALESALRQWSTAPTDPSGS